MITVATISATATSAHASMIRSRVVMTCASSDQPVREAATLGGRVRMRRLVLPCIRQMFGKMSRDL